MHSPADRPSPLACYQRRFIAHLRNPDAEAPPQGIPAARIGVYVELLRNKIEDSLLACFPVLHARLGEDRWQRLAGEFIARHRCVSPFYRQIPDEFVAYLQDERMEAGDPPFWAELAHYEWMELVLSIAEGEPDFSAIDPEGDVLAGSPVLVPTLALLHYRYPVHRLGPQTADPEPVPGAAPFYLLGYRDGDDEVRFIEISAATARLIALLREPGGTGAGALARLAEELRHPDCAAMAQFGAEILWNLERQGVILGTEAARAI